MEVKKRGLKDDFKTSWPETLRDGVIININYKDCREVDWDEESQSLHLDIITLRCPFDIQ